ncbi:MAG TPA: argininosuccinate lyase [Allosphingosinicella sp.]|jgi:hypothetical protein
MRNMTLGAAFVLSMAGASPALAGTQDFVLINDTGYNISEIYVAPSREADWQEDVLGQDILSKGSRVNIHFDRSEDTCLWDLKAVYDDGDTATWQAFNLCEVSVISISYNDSTGQTTATYE